MKISTVSQGTPEWLALRAGKITGTDIAPFCLDPRPIGLTIPKIQKELDILGITYKKSGSRDELIALLPNNGDGYRELSNAARNLLVTKITDSKPKDAWQIAQDDAAERKLSYMVAIQRGKHLEPAARMFYERKTNLKVEQVGFISSDCENHGMSPDGVVMLEENLIDMRPSRIERVLEIKCPMPETHRRWLLDHYGKGTVPDEHFWQCQMGMVVCECDKVDFLSFCPGEAQLLVTIHRSEVTEQLANGLQILAMEKARIEGNFAAMWENEYGTPEGSKLLFYPNGNPMFAPDGMMLNDDGTRSIFDDVDAYGSEEEIATGADA